MKNANKILDLLSAFMAVIGICAAVLVCFIVIYSGTNGSFSQKENAILSQNTAQAETQIGDNQNATNFRLADTSSEKNPYSEAIKTGTHNINDVEFWFSDSVINDVTGKWKLSSIASSIDITEYAIDYYNTLFSSDDEIHAVVNFSLNTTTSLSVPSDGILDVAIHEYIDREEHDAKILFSGMLLAEYEININTGDIKKIQ